MSKFVVIDIKNGTCSILGGKAELSREIGVSVPTITKWFLGRDIFLYEDKVLGCSENGKPKKEK